VKYDPDHRRTWKGKKLGKRTSAACDSPNRALGSPEGHRHLHGFYTTTELLIGEHIALLVAKDGDKAKARESIDALLAHVLEEAERIAKWAITKAAAEAARERLGDLKGSA
jgi:hypothetical protein